ARRHLGAGPVGPPARRRHDLGPRRAPRVLSDETERLPLPGASRDGDGARAPGRVLRVVVGYDGTDFSGWQRQPGMRTVEGVLEEGIRALLGEEVFVRGAGRTDAGVHADGQVASFTLASRIPPHGLLKGLNSILPLDVALLEVAEAAPDFDARFSA